MDRELELKDEAEIWNEQYSRKLVSSAYITAFIGMMTYIPGTLFSAFIIEERGSLENVYIRFFPLFPTLITAYLLFRKKISAKVFAYTIWMSLFLSAGFAASSLSKNFDTLIASILANIPIIIAPAILLFWHYKHSLFNCVFGFLVNVLFAYLFNPENFSKYITYWLILLPIALAAITISGLRYQYFRIIFFNALKLAKVNQVLEKQKQQIVKQNLQLQEKNEELNTQAFSLTEMNSMKNRFISIMAHDLKNSFNEILGLSKILMEDAEEESLEDVKTYSRYVHNSAQNTYTMLNSLLEWSRAHDGKLILHPQNIEINTLLLNVISLLQSRADKKNITINRNFEKKLFLYADENSLSTIFFNLIGNAIKFTYLNGKIEIDLEETEYCIRINIRDNGQGIAKKDLDKIFSLEHNFQTEGTEGERGTGIGLILCAELIEKNKGQISVESELSKGSTFSLLLPKSEIPCAES
ncbi:MAG: HAMP domain-containing histidine kinase [Leptospiraceae bacterium]|nr:HAMP domain-containing histidine kinase [Leptospiraceae bacterium]MCP5499206.1 HAMP domain-containing histidine kinase [Leptospiraceae bacterium]